MYLVGFGRTRLSLGSYLRELLDTFPNVGVIQHIDAAKVDSFTLKHLDNFPRETTHGLGWISFHVQHDWITRDMFLSIINKIIAKQTRE
jgi:hypothetical protein